MSDAETLDRPSTDLVPIEQLTAVQVFRAGGVDDVIERIRRMVADTTVDISTPAGRKACASLAYKIARSKTALDEMGKALNEERRAQINLVDADRRRIRSELDALAEEVRKPLTDYENAEKERIAGHEAAIASMVESPSYGLTETSADLRLRLDYLRNYPARDWREFAERASMTLKAEIARAEDLLAKAVKREEEAAELARLREEAAQRERETQARLQAERDARLQAEAAERARREAEERAAAERAEMERQAQAERDAAARREQAAKDAATAAERREAEARARAEEQRKADAEAAERRQAAAVAAERLRQEQEAARQRAQAEQERAEAERRAADKAYRGRINRAAVNALMTSAGVSEDDAIAIVTCIARGAIPAVSIAY